MNTHSNEHLHCREFGSACLDVQHLQEWLAKHRRRIPIVLTRDYVQVEWLLSAIQAQVEQSVTPAEAAEIVLADPLLRDHEMAELSPHWLLGGEAHRRWALLIGEAVNAGEFQLLDFPAKLPLGPTGAESAASDEPLRKDWEHSARSYAVEICRTEIGKGREPTQEKVGEEVVVLLRNAEILTHKKKAISHAYVMKALQPWTAPDEAREMLGKKKITGK